MRPSTWIGLACGLLAACGGSSYDLRTNSDAPGVADAGARPGGGQAAPGPMSPGSGAPAPTPLPPEREETRVFETPSAGAQFVYVANTRRDTVAVIDARTLGIRSVDVGDAPTVLRTVPGRDVALVINVGTRDLSILRTSPAAMTRVTTVPIVRGANALAVAPDGRHAIAWFDSRVPGAAAAATSFQDVSVITLDEAGDTALATTVGFRPSEIVFSSDAQAAFVVTEDGISVLRFADLARAPVARLVRVPDGPGAAVARDLTVTPDGRFALARREGASAVELVDLASGAARTLDLGSPVTDLDLHPSGAFALAVLRAESTWVRIPVPDGFAAPDSVVRRRLDGETVGSATFSGDGKRALLYTTTGGGDRLVIVNLEGDAAPAAVRLRKGARAIAAAPDGRTAIVVHDRAMGDAKAAGLSVEEQIARSFGYTLVDLGTGLAKLQLTEADVGPLALTPDGSRAFVLQRDDARGIRSVQRIALATFIVDEVPLGSPPVALAPLAAATRLVFVSQVHPEGRISFIDWETGAVSSVTGFELNGRIVQ
jgi:DNA-binding beta-propeller fold protein YncE